MVNLIRSRALWIAVVASLAAIALLATRPWGAARASWFTDVTREAGIGFVHTNGLTGRCLYPEIMGGGIAMFDFDGDGDLDLYFVNGNHLAKPRSPSITNVLYRNNGDGTFTDVTAAAGVGDTGYGQGCCAADYDNDGDQDLYVTNLGPDRLYRNNGDGTFSDATESAGIDNPRWGQACAFLDYDNDGRLDLYVQNYLTYSSDSNATASVNIGGEQVPEYPSPRSFSGAPDRLYRNNGDGTFTDVSQAAGIDLPGGRGMGLACVDFDEDGDLDLFVANDGMENYFFYNNGNGTFREASIQAGVAYNIDGTAESSMGDDVGDVDGDGRLDIVCPALSYECCTLYRNKGGFFVDASRETRIAAATRKMTGFSPNLFDADNDGDLDLFLSNGGVAVNHGASPRDSFEKRYGMPDQLLVNDGKGGFDPAADAGPYFERALIGRGSAAGDLDNDGDLDLVISNLSGAAVVLRNDAPQGSWITLTLVATKGNRDAIGAKIRCTAAGRKQVAVIRGGGSYLSQNDRRVHFGVGDAARIDRIDVVWPSGDTQTLTDVAPNQFLEVRQDSR